MDCGEAREETGKLVCGVGGGGALAVVQGEMKVMRRRVEMASGYVQSSRDTLLSASPYTLRRDSHPVVPSKSSLSDTFGS